MNRIVVMPMWLGHEAQEVTCGLVDWTVSSGCQSVTDVSMGGNARPATFAARGIWCVAPRAAAGQTHLGHGPAHSGHRFPRDAARPSNLAQDDAVLRVGRKAPFQQAVADRLRRMHAGRDTTLEHVLNHRTGDGPRRSGHR